MERKKFNRGTMVGGIVRIIIALIALAIAITVITSIIGSADPEDTFGTIFMCIIAGIMIVASISFVINGIKMIIDGKKSFEISRKGHTATGKIIDLTETEVTENNNGCVSHYIIYTDDFGNLCESQEQVSQKIYEKLKELTLVPILVYKERAIFDKKKFDEENNID